VVVNTIAVIGAGTMGRIIAYTVVVGGYRAVLEDTSPEALDKGVAWIKQMIAEESVHGNGKAGEHDKMLALISTSNRVEDAVREADLIIETVADDLEMKLELFTIFDKFAKPGAIFASSTSSLSITDLSDVVVHRERCVGLRFLPAEAKPQRIEFVRTAFTSSETVDRCRELARRMGKEVVVVEEGERGSEGERSVDDNVQEKAAEA